MCTALNTNKSLHLFGRTLDFEHSFEEQVISTPRNFSYGDFLCSLSIIGVGRMEDGAALYFDGMNESGLCGAGLNFPTEAVYHSARSGCTNLRSYQLLPYILGRCRSLSEAREELKRINVTPESLSPLLKATPLHWIFADSEGALTVESVKDGLRIYENRVGVLTNAPGFDFHEKSLIAYTHLSAAQPENRSGLRTDKPYSRGMGAFGLPGDFSSTSRFVRAAFLLENSRSDGSTDGEISRFFHVADSVSVPLGVMLSDLGEPICTRYTCCACPRRLTYYLTTYHNRQPIAFPLDPSLSHPTTHPLYSK